MLDIFEWLFSQYSVVSVGVQFLLWTFFVLNYKILTVLLFSIIWLSVENIFKI